MAHVRATGAVLAVGAALALAAGLRHSATQYPADKELGPWSSYFALNSQVKLVRNPGYHAYVSSQLNSMRLIGDELADAVVASVPQALWHHPQLWALVKMVAARGITYEEAATSLQQDATLGEIDLRSATFANENSAEAKLCKQLRIVPDWLDPAQIEAGREVHEMNAVSIGTVLLCGSLVLSYACKNGNKVLMETRRLSAGTEGVWRRLAETWHFVLSVQGSKDSLAIGGAGYDAAASVRLLHAVVRRYCVRKEWNVAAYGSPINQEDMLGTLASFSPCVIIGMEKIGLTFTPAEQDAYCARWRYVGYLLGLTPEALALISNYNSARYVGEVIALRQLAPDEDSTRLTTMSLEAVESHYPVLSKLPRPMKNVLTFWCRWFLGNELADAMEVPKPSWVTLLWWAFVRAMMKIGFFVSRNFPFLRPIWKALNCFHASRTSRVEFGGRRRIPIAFKTA